MQLLLVFAGDCLPVKHCFCCDSCCYLLVVVDGFLLAAKSVLISACCYLQMSASLIDCCGLLLIAAGCWKKVFADDGIRSLLAADCYLVLFVVAVVAELLL